MRLRHGRRSPWGCTSGWRVGLVAVAQKRELRRRAISVAVQDEKKKAKPPKPPPPPKPIVHRRRQGASRSRPRRAARRRWRTRAAAPVAMNLAMSNARPRRRPRHRTRGRAKPTAAAASRSPRRSPSGAPKRTRDEAGGGGADAPCTRGADQAGADRQDADSTTRVYPQAQADGIEGQVKLRLTVDADGEVASVDVLPASTRRSTRRSWPPCKRWRFKPAMACGKPVAGGTYVVRGRSSSATERCHPPSLPTLFAAGDPPRARSRLCARRSDARPTGAGRHQAAQAGEVRPGGLPQGQARRAASPASVLLSIEIGDDGKVGDVEVVKGAAPDFDAAAVAAAKQFVFEPAEIDHQPAPVKITYRYDFTIVDGDRQGRAADQLRRRRPRALQEEAASPRVDRHARRPRRLTAVTDEDGHFAFTDVPLGHAQGRALQPQAHHGDHRGDDRRRQAAHGEVPRRGEGGGRRRGGGGARAAHQEGGGRDAHPHRGGAARPRHAGRHAQGRAEPARRRPRSSFGSGELIVWGSAPNETRVNVDGVEIPALYHVGGLRSTINSDLVRSIDLSPGSYGAEYGRGLGGLVRIELAAAAQGGRARLRRRRRASTPRRSSRRRSRRRLRLALAGRISYLDRAAAAASPRRTSATSSPSRATTTTRRARTLALRRDEELALTFLGVGRSPAPRHPRLAIRPRCARENTDTGCKRLILRYTRLLPDGARVVVTPSFGFDNSQQR